MFYIQDRYFGDKIHTHMYAFTTMACTCCTTLAKKKLRQPRMANYRHVKARETTRLYPLARGCLNFFDQGSISIGFNSMVLRTHTVVEYFLTS